jgi:hypothetical protein
MCVYIYVYIIIVYIYVYARYLRARVKERERDVCVCVYACFSLPFALQPRLYRGWDWVAFKVDAGQQVQLLAMSQAVVIPRVNVWGPSTPVTSTKPCPRKHKNIVKYIHSIRTDTHLNIVLEYVEGRGCWPCQTLRLQSWV